MKTDLQQHVNGEENGGPLTGSVEFWVDNIVNFYKDLQMESFTFWPANERTEQVELFAKKVVPRAKEEIKNALLLRKSDSIQFLLFLLILLLILLLLFPELIGSSMNNRYRLFSHYQAMLPKRKE